MAFQIVVLDGYTLNPGDLSWAELETLGACTVYDRTPADLVRERAASADIVLTNKVALDRETIAALPRLKYIGVLATGYNVVDLQAAGERGIPVTNVPAYSTESVAQMVFALLLEMARHTGHHAQLVAAGRWSSNPDFCFWDRSQVELSGLHFGIVGFGNIGRAVARVAKAFGMKVMVYTRHPQRYQGTPTAEDVEFVELADLFQESDIISLHCPLTLETEGLVNAERLSSMKKSALLINTGRGPLVDEEALAKALHRGTIAGAALDVLSLEPPPSDNPLLSAPNCQITPHIAWATRAARERLTAVAIANIRAFLDGAPQNVVNGPG
jgi:glycerate dehydrogenase